MIISKTINDKLGKLLGTNLFTVTEICRGGSSRRFYRVSSEKTSLILSITKDMEEFKYYVEFAGFFEKNEIPVPHFYETFEADGAVIMYDAGRESLFDIVKKTESPDEIIRIYSRVLSLLRNFQRIDSSECPLLESRPFDFNSLIWESSYFAEFFLCQHLGMTEIPKSVTDNFQYIAKTLSLLRHVPMHRDFQSQNILLKDGMIFFIDFQGARKGCLFYDAASLINDPYVDFSEDMVSGLFDIFYAMLDHDTSYEDALKLFNFASVSRLMQALGAYANLSLNKGKPDFAKHIPAGLRKLIAVLSKCGELSALYDFLAHSASLSSK